MSKLIITTISIFVLLILVYLAIPFFFDIPKNSIIAEFNSKTSILSSDRKSSLKDGFKFYEKNCKNLNFVLSSFSVFTPKYSFICSINESSHKVYNFSFNRNLGINWNISDVQTIQFSNYKVESVIKIMESVNLDETNPDPKNIRVAPQR